MEKIRANKYNPPHPFSFIVICNFYIVWDIFMNIACIHRYNFLLNNATYSKDRSRY